MTLRPRVLLVVPIRNAMKYLPATVESFIAAVKHYGNAELVLVDNGSTDGTWERLVAKYSAQARILRFARRSSRPCAIMAQQRPNATFSALLMPTASSHRITSIRQWRSLTRQRWMCPDLAMNCRKNQTGLKRHGRDYCHPRKKGLFSTSHPGTSCFAKRPSKQLAALMRHS